MSFRGKRHFLEPKNYNHCVKMMVFIKRGIKIGRFSYIIKNVMKTIARIKYFFLSLFILTNAVIVFESTLPSSISSQRSSFFADIAAFLINGVLPEQEPDIIHVDSLIVLDHQSQPIAEGGSISIPLGVTRRFTTDIGPANASDKNVIWTSDHPETLRVTSGGFLEARALGEDVRVSVHSVDGGIEQYFYVDIVPKSAPTDFVATLRQTQIELGQSTRLDITLDELSQREYDVNQLNYRSSQPSVATINEYGVINAVGVGRSLISVVGDERTYELTVVANTSEIIRPSTLTLSGPDFSYVYGYTQLAVQFDRDDVSDASLTFVSSNEAIATVDEHGLLYGTKVSGRVTITAYSNADFSVYDQLELDIFDVLPTSMNLQARTNSIEAGKKLTIDVMLSHNLSDETLPITNQEVSFTSSDEAVATVTSLNGKGIVVGLKKGSVTIIATSVANPELSSEINVSITPIEAINQNNQQDFYMFIRKGVGHFTLFFINGVLGAITFYLFLPSLSLIKRLLLAAIPGVFFAGLSEFLQLFAAGRGSTFSDVLIDSIGYIVALVLVGLFLYIKDRKKTLR